MQLSFVLYKYSLKPVHNVHSANSLKESISSHFENAVASIEDKFVYKAECIYGYNGYKFQKWKVTFLYAHNKCSLYVALTVNSDTDNRLRPLQIKCLKRTAVLLPPL